MFEVEIRKYKYNKILTQQKKSQKKCRKERSKYENISGKLKKKDTAAKQQTKFGIIYLTLWSYM